MYIYSLLTVKVLQLTKNMLTNKRPNVDKQQPFSFQIVSK